MNPSADDRLNSVLRALETVVLPALPPEASLAQEQVMLAMGHIQIIQAQRDVTPAYEQDELDDISAMARELLKVEGVPETASDATHALAAALNNENGHPRERAEAIRKAIDAVLVSARQSGAKEYHMALARVILPLGCERARKDREWFAPMGFDIELSPSG